MLSRTIFTPPAGGSSATTPIASVGARFGRVGIALAADVGALAVEAPVIITSLPKASALAATVAAIAAARVPRRVVIEASTFKLEDKEAAEAALRKAGHILLDCPVSGTGIQAKTKDLVIYASGGAANRETAPAVRRLSAKCTTSAPSATAAR